jgi:hypothetical protein
MKDTRTEAYLLADYQLAQLMGFSSRPKKWGKVVQAYLDLDPEDRVTITKDEVQGLIDWFAPGAKKKRNQEEEKSKQRRREAKAKALKVRNLPQSPSGKMLSLMNLL